MLIDERLIKNNNVKKRKKEKKGLDILMKVTLNIIYSFLQLIITSFTKHEQIQIPKLGTWLCNELFMILYSSRIR